ncbi:hypothetical protein JY409_04585 [Stenotrophomonas maltophilia]|uniref:hypothetical protein n=1 Tax=Stenotrophomonas maltophilia TaxID=40324 RepID=UPI0007F0479D|nr:hypothetical protein [Stenotrophomonas maltophilia]MBN4937319.1 hypothetical protein [Stenotrophomonas maltophilia]OBU50146.1 hypothetical protein A9K76_08010 [Stenotrophomonas maltophilia]
MAEDIKADELLDQLRESYVASIRAAEPGIPAHAALQIADMLVTVQMDVFAGKRVRYRSKAEFNGAAIAEDWARGMPVQEIMRKHNCSRSAAYKYHPARQGASG